MGSVLNRYTLVGGQCVKKVYTLQKVDSVLNKYPLVGGQCVKLSNRVHLTVKSRYIQKIL